MRRVLNILCWAGIIVPGLATAILEDVMFVLVLVPNLPASLDLKGNLFWVFTVPLAQLMALVVTGGLAWRLGLRRPARLITFWLCWSVGRAAFLTLINNPAGDVALYTSSGSRSGASLSRGSTGSRRPRPRLRRWSLEAARS